MTWAPPTELTLSVTAYVIDYSVLPDGPTLSIVLGPNKFYFAISTTRFEGKLLVIRITARTENVKGDASQPLYVRAPCHRTIDVDHGVEKNISSPNYPGQYPAGIICTWSIRTNLEPTLAAKFLDFQLDDSSFCSSDYITLSINPDQRLCGVITPFTFEAVGSTLDVKFVSDGEKQKRGFLLQVRSKEGQRGLTSEQLFSSTQILPTSPVPQLQTTKTKKMTSKGVTTLGKTTLTSSTLSISISAITSSLLSSPQAVSSKPPSPSASPASLKAIEVTDHQPNLASFSTRTPLLTFEKITNSIYINSSKSAVYSLVNWSISTERLHSHGQATSPTPDGLQYPVSIWLKFIPSGLNTSDEFGRELQKKLRPIFNTSEAFEDIYIVQNLLLNTSLMLIYARYNLLKTLTMMATNSTFDLITYLNDTSLDIIQKGNLVISEWRLNTSFVEEFRKSDKLRNERLSNICERLAKVLKKDVCKNSYPYPVSCVVSNVYNIGVACRMECPAMGCTKCVIHNSTGTISCNDTRTPSKPESLLVPLASSMGGACVVIGLLLGCITRRKRKRRMKLNLQASLSERQPHVEMVDMFQNENSRWHTTSSLTPNQRAIIANRRASFPNVRGVKVNKEVERGMRQFETFIEDKESLRKRLNKKHSIRRTNSF
ncbi:hypothetical protein ACJMK2_026646 [Sinanodonta woodiana]|uniref:CUB domain-containing protein n=1 Tax=Sinanodonta woodiana TaxID=1069815 RepID=A0ABD3XM44_SINWO